MLEPIALGCVTAAYCAALYRDCAKHMRRLAKIPIRIHVNGTRGKSTVTRLIAGGLRAGGIRTVAKTTGTTPRVILPDGSERPILRYNGASIGEQISAVQIAAEEGARAVVLECMAVDPSYQWISEHRIIQSSIGVITNVRFDHSDLMGSDLRQMASCLANTIPKSGTLVTPEVENLDILRDRAGRLGTTVHHVSASEVTQAELDGFSYHSFADNVATALAVCGHMGVDRETALAGMHECAPDPGTLWVCRASMLGKQVCFVNALAANDVQSTRQIWDAVMLGHPGWQKVILFCSRKDRMARSAEFVNEITSGWDFGLTLLAGEETAVIRRRLLARGIPASRVIDLGRVDPEAMVDRVAGRLLDNTVLFAAGNIVGLGEAIAAYFFERGTCEPIYADTCYRAADLTRAL